jgi:MutS domain V
LEGLRRAARFFEGGLARLDGHWAGRGQTGQHYLDPTHPYAQDLDLFGKGSVFELLSTARTHIGEDTLARWLLAPADPATLVQRQQAVDELRLRLGLREDLAVVAEEARTGVDPVSLAAWGDAPALLPPATRPMLWLFTAIGLVGFAGAIATILQLGGILQLSERAATISRDVAFIVLLANGAFLYRKRAHVDQVVIAVEQAASELQLLAGVLERLERERFQSPRLAELGESLASDGAPPSQRIARLARILENLDSRDNVFVRVAGVFILWTAHWALAVEEWRRHSGAAVRSWLTAVGEIEALCSLASYAYENPADPYPEFSTGSPVLEAADIGHPLIPMDRLVRNDVCLGGTAGPRVLVVSGSNMSGKSTLLRTLGVNCVLAQAGAPVRARHLRISPLSVGASIRVIDSLQEGVSRFYAEILRLRQILDLTQNPRRVLFLIDEVLHGTNSHDRRIGAEALVRGLVERGSIGLITTHDLALADITGKLGERAANVHFEDQIENGQIHFDYLMRPGVVRKSNAIELMRQVGLEI